MPASNNMPPSIDDSPHGGSAAAPPLTTIHLDTPEKPRDDDSKSCAAAETGEDTSSSSVMHTMKAKGPDGESKPKSINEGVALEDEAGCWNRLTMGWFTNVLWLGTQR